ncbi:DUF1353 domain-containing protein [bacterium]|nr:MAG: DUF1353 domain-containing protein [bacterium]
MSSFTKHPPLEAIPPDYKLYRTIIAFEYHVGSEDSNEIIGVPKGFITDGASIPSFAWSIIGGPLGKYAPAAIVHDFCYKYKLYVRLKCDRIFLEAMKVLGVGWWKRGTMYNFVRWFAWINWKKRRKREEVD